MLNAGNIVQIETGKTLSSTVATYEGNQSEYAVFHEFVVKLTAPSSLVGGILKLEQFEPFTNGWLNASQVVTLVASGSGTPGVVNSNTASTTAIVGGVTWNNTGITAISDTATVILQMTGNGKRVRLNTIATSGTATLGYSYVGFRQRA